MDSIGDDEKFINGYWMHRELADCSLQLDNKRKNLQVKRELYYLNKQAVKPGAVRPLIR